jgi:hypothetical protein
MQITVSTPNSTATADLTEQEKSQESCCCRSGWFAWLTLIFNMIFMSAVLTVSAYTLIIVIVKLNAIESQDHLSLADPIVRQADNMKIFIPLMVGHVTTFIFAAISIGYSVVLMAKPRLHFGLYLPTWFSIGKLILDISISVVLFQVTEGMFVKSADREEIYFQPILFAIITFTQLFLHLSFTIALCIQGNNGRSCCLPWNVNENGEVYCC